MNKILKRFVLFALFAFVLAGISGCAWTHSVQGSGDTQTKEFTPGSFSSVEIDGYFQLIYVNSETCSVKAELQENLMPYLDISVYNDKLTVRTKKNFLYSHNNIGKVYVSSPSLKSIDIDGAVEFLESSPITADTLALSISGAGNVDIAINVTTLNISSSGLGKIYLKGTANQADLEISGAGTIDALNLVTLNSSVTISGAGGCSLTCNELLNVNISGLGNLKYKGNPQVTKNISGLGGIEPIEG